MKEKILTAFLNLIKVKSIVTFATIYLLIYLVKAHEIEAATSTAIIMLVFKELFDKNKSNKGSDDDDNLQK